jgi:hypothetical protein
MIAVGEGCVKSAHAPVSPSRNLVIRGCVWRKMRTLTHPPVQTSRRFHIGPLSTSATTALSSSSTTSSFGFALGSGACWGLCLRPSFRVEFRDQVAASPRAWLLSNPQPGAAAAGSKRQSSRVRLRREAGQRQMPRCRFPGGALTAAMPRALTPLLMAGRSGVRRSVSAGGLRQF